MKSLAAALRLGWKWEKRLECNCCNKRRATVHVLEIGEGALHQEKHLCTACARKGKLFVRAAKRRKCPSCGIKRFGRTHKEPK